MAFLFGFTQPSQAQTKTVSSHLMRTYQTISKAFLVGRKFRGDTVQKAPNSRYLNKIYPINRLSVSFILLLSSVIYHPTSVFADTLTSPAFEIDMSTINITGGSKSSASFKLTDTVGQTFQGRFDSAGFVIKAGFQYIYTLIPFTFTISNLDLDFGSLISGTPSLLTNLLTVTTGSAYGYTVKAIEDHPLRLNNGVTTIPDTSCDLASPCTQSDATIWADNARYGFGYNIQGTDVDIAEFVDNSYFRPFPVQNLDQPATIMSRVGVATDSAATVTYKVNISGVQAAGTYQNNLQFIAIPSF